MQHRFGYLAYNTNLTSVRLKENYSKKIILNNMIMILKKVKVNGYQQSNGVKLGFMLLLTKDFDLYDLIKHVYA